MNEIIEKIASDYLGIETLESQGLDRLDFHDVGVASLKDALERAYQEGVKLQQDKEDEVVLKFSYKDYCIVHAGLMYLISMLQHKENETKKEHMDEVMSIYDYVGSFMSSGYQDKLKDSINE